MVASKCDRCGNFYDYYKGSKLFGNGEAVNSIAFITDTSPNGNYSVKRSYDLCPACMKKLEEFMKGE